MHFFVFNPCPILVFLAVAVFALPQSEYSVFEGNTTVDCPIKLVSGILTFDIKVNVTAMMPNGSNDATAPAGKVTITLKGSGYLMFTYL